VNYSKILVGYFSKGYLILIQRRVLACCLPYFVFKVSILRVVHDDAEFVLQLKGLVILDDVGVVQILKHFDLGVIGKGVTSLLYSFFSSSRMVIGTRFMAKSWAVRKGIYTWESDFRLTRRTWPKVP